MLLLGKASEWMTAFAAPKFGRRRSRPMNLFCRLAEGEAEGTGDALAIGRIGATAIGNVPLLDVQTCIAHRSGGVVEEPLLLGGRHQPEKIARLLPVVVIDAMVIVRPVTVHLHR